MFHIFTSKALITSIESSNHLGTQITVAIQYYSWKVEKNKKKGTIIFISWWFFFCSYPKVDLNCTQTWLRQNVIHILAKIGNEFLIKESKYVPGHQNTFDMCTVFSALHVSSNWINGSGIMHELENDFILLRQTIKLLVMIRSITSKY